MARSIWRFPSTRGTALPCSNFSDVRTSEGAGKPRSHHPLNGGAENAEMAYEGNRVPAGLSPFVHVEPPQRAIPLYAHGASYIASRLSNIRLSKAD